MKIPNSEITPYQLYLNRRKFIKSTALASIGASLPKSLSANHSDNSEVSPTLVSLLSIVSKPS